MAGFWLSEAKRIPDSVDGRSSAATASGRVAVDGSVDASHALMPPRRKKSARAEIESDLLDSPRWSGLRQQQRLQEKK